MRLEEVTGTPPEEAEEAWRRFRRAGVQVGTFPVPSPVGPRNVPYIGIADIAPGRHVAIFIPERDAGGWQPLSQREREGAAPVAGGAAAPRPRAPRPGGGGGRAPPAAPGDGRSPRSCR